MIDANCASTSWDYYTAVEEHFQRVRGVRVFLLSPADSKLLESWKSAGVPLAAVLRGIDRTFKIWRSKPQKTQMINSIAFCAQAVLSEARRMVGTGQPQVTRLRHLFDADAVRDILVQIATALREAQLDETASAMELLLSGPLDELEYVEQRLGALEQEVISTLRTRQSEVEARAARQSLDRQLRPYRGRMTAEQFDALERQYLGRIILNKAGVRHLSLFGWFPPMRA